MAELERLEAAFRAADAKAQAGDEQARADAGMFAKEIRRLQSDAQAPWLAQKMAPVNEGIARTIDGAAGAVNRGVNAGIRGAAGAVGVDDPFQFDEQPVRSMMDSAGIRTMDGRAPETFGERVGVGAGEGAAFLLPSMLLGKALQAGGAVASGVGQAISRPFTATPVRATAAEMAAGAGARVGGQAAEDMTGSDNALVRTTGELAGGLAAAAGPGAAMRATGAAVQAMPVAGTAIRGVRAAVAPFTESGSRVRAEDRLRGLVADPDAIVQSLDGESIGGLTPAQRTNDPNLMALERAVTDTDPALRDQLSARAAESADTLRGELRAPARGATAEDASPFITQRREAFRKRLEARKDAANERARERVQKLDPARRESDNALIVREEIDRAYEGAVSQERELWSRVPKNATVDTQNAREAYAALAADTGRARAGDIPIEARELLENTGTGFKDVESVREMHALYSQMRQRAREALSGVAPNENRARIANNIADAILVDLGATDDLPTAAGRAINEARAFSREVNEIFGQGTVGALTSRQRSGGAAVAPEAALQGSVGVGGVRGAVAVDDIRRAAGNNADVSIEDYLRGRLSDRANLRGEYGPDRADAFNAANRETLQRFPELQGDIGAANAATREAASKTKRVDGIVKALDNPRNVSAAFLSANKGDEIAQAVFKARNPVQAAAALRRQASKDPSGRALDGIKGGFLDNLIQRSAGGFDDAGTPLIDGNALNGALQDPQTRSALAQVFNPQEISRMDRIAREFQGLDGARSGRTLPAVMDDTPNSVISLIAGTFAARQGAALGAGTSGASLRTANLATKRMNDILDRLTNDRAERLIRSAITDKDLFVSLMSKSNSPSAQKMRETRLTEWLIGVAGVNASELSDD